jgi:glycosyltransferase involved in cell wall biosynthesis
VLKYIERWEDYTKESPLCHFQDLPAKRVFYPRLPGNWFNRWSGLSLYLSIKRIVRKLHSENKFDIIYATDLFPDGDAAARLSRYLDIPATCLAIGIDANQTAFASRTLYNHFVRVINKLDGTLACGQSVADKMDKRTGHNALCVYGVVDFDKFFPVDDKSSVREVLGLSEDCLYLLYAGYLDKRKGLYELFDAFAEVKNKKKVKLILCGDGSERENLKQYAEQKGISDSVIMPGMIEPEDMNKWLKACDLFVLPSYSEGMPNVVMEAMACGVPVIATKVGGLPEAVGESEGAVLVEPKNVQSLGSALREVITNSDMRIRMGKAARELAVEKFGVRRSAKRILDYLQTIIERD